MPPAPSTPATVGDYLIAVSRRDGSVFQQSRPTPPPTFNRTPAPTGLRKPRPLRVMTPRCASHTGGTAR